MSYNLKITKWQYLVAYEINDQYFYGLKPGGLKMDESEGKSITEFLNYWGEEGFELVSLVEHPFDTMFVFKRSAGEDILKG